MRISLLNGRNRNTHSSRSAMESFPLFRAASVSSVALHSPRPAASPSSPILNRCPPPRPCHRLRPSAMKSPRGFGPSPPQKTKRRKKQTFDEDSKDEAKEEEEEYDGDDRDATIPEVVTDRMMRRMGLSVGIPLTAGLLFFPFFYYLKVALKIDVPTWIPFIVSFIFFGTALLGVSYGIVSASWDPLREGSLLGWNEARRNWPVFWESLWGKK